MRIPLLKFLCLLALVACAPLAHAQVYRCIGTHGEPVFSGEPCGAPASSGTDVASPANGFGAACAASPGVLKQELANAFTAHDVNRLSGLILWRDMDQASARTALRALTAWLKQPLTGIAVAYATGPPFAEAGPAPATSAGDPAGASSVATQPPTGFDISTGGVDGSTRDFGVTESGGCWWLTF